MDQFLTYTITPLLDEPEKLKISVNDNAVTVEVAEVDTGKVIGKHGSVIHALRVLLKTYCLSHDLPQAALILNAPIKKD